jgi:hypothetical protein
MKIDENSEGKETTKKAIFFATALVNTINS